MASHVSTGWPLLKAAVVPGDGGKAAKGFRQQQPQVQNRHGSTIVQQASFHDDRTQTTEAYSNALSPTILTREGYSGPGGAGGAPHDRPGGQCGRAGAGREGGAECGRIPPFHHQHQAPPQVCLFPSSLEARFMGIADRSKELS